MAETKKYRFSSKDAYFLLLLILVMLVVPTLLHAQPGTGDSSDTPDSPIDGGLSVLLAAGIGYGAKKLYNYKNKK